jgi:NADPH-dependent curcumin reductase CurA
VKSTVNRLYRLRRRPVGQVCDRDLEWLEEPVADLAEGQALIRTHYLSLDPTSRVWMSSTRGYMPPVELNAVMRGVGVGQVVESRRDDLPAGSFVQGFTGWQDYCVVDNSRPETSFTVLPDPLPAPLHTFLGVLGHTGITAYLGVEIGDPKPGETFIVSAAAGAVGSIAGQLAKQRGARVVGIAGGPEKCRYVVEELGFDVCVDRHAEDWRVRLDKATPLGIDVDFENAGGKIMDHILGRLNVGARIPLCGMVAEYNSYGEKGDRAILLNLDQLLMQRVKLTGFIVADYVDRFSEIIGRIAASLEARTLRYEETVVAGLENAREALNTVFSGETRGKLVIKVADPAES